MIIGQVLLGTAGATPDVVEYFSRWFQRGGNGATFTADMINHGLVGAGGLSSFEIEVWTKNSEDDDLGAVLLNSITSGGPTQAITLAKFTRTAWEVGANLQDRTTPGFKELVRFRYLLKFTDIGDAGWVHFRMLNPTWLSNGA